MTRVLAIDQGTSATKAIVFDADGTVVAHAQVEVRPNALGGGRVEQDPGELWQSVVAAGRTALRRARGEVAAVGLANQGETVVAWDPSTGEPYGCALSWQDQRGAEVCERMAARAPEIHAATGLPLAPYFSAPKMAWLREHAGLPARAVLTTTDTWLLHRLTGAYVTDAATASRTLLLDLDTTEWSPAMGELFGVDVRTLPRVASGAEPLGETRAFGPPLLVAGFTVDQQAALFAQNCRALGEAKCTYGTGAFLQACLGGTPVRSAAGLASSVAWRLGGMTTYCLDGQVFTVGAAVRWLCDLGIIEHPSDLDSMTCGAQDVGSLPAAGIGPDLRSEVMFVPALAGLAAPYWRSRARAAFLGMSLSTGRAELVRAVVNGIAASVALLARVVAADVGAPLARLRADGGLVRSRALMQAQADLLQTPVEIFPSPHASAAGVAALARLGAGLAATPQEAIPRHVPAAVYEPSLGADTAAAYLERFEEAIERATGEAAS